MPIYDFICSNEDCNFHTSPMSEFFSLYSKVVDEKECPRCGAKMVRQSVYPLQFSLKGGGWPGKNIKEKGVA